MTFLSVSKELLPLSPLAGTIHGKDIFVDADAQTTRAHLELKLLHYKDINNQHFTK